MTRKIRLRESMKKSIFNNIINIKTLRLAALALLALISIYLKLSTPIVDVIDCDFYYDEVADKLYAFVIEDRLCTKRNTLVDKTYKCGKNVRIYSKNLDDSFTYDEISSKSKRMLAFMHYDISNTLSDMKLIYEKDFSKVNPWTITVGQLDEDEAIELFVGAYRPTYFYDDAPRPYFMEYKDGVIVRQWTGSYLDNLGFVSAEMVDDDLDGISEVLIGEIVAGKNAVSIQESRFSIRGFTPYRIE